MFRLYLPPCLSEAGGTFARCRWLVAWDLRSLPIYSSDHYRRASSESPPHLGKSRGGLFQKKETCTGMRKIMIVVFELRRSIPRRRGRRPLCGLFGQDRQGAFQPKYFPHELRRDYVPLHGWCGLLRRCCLGQFRQAGPREVSVGHQTSLLWWRSIGFPFETVWKDSRGCQPNQNGARPS